MILGSVELVDAHPAAGLGCCAPWGENDYRTGKGELVTDVVHLVLENPRPLTVPIEARGRLGLWTPDPELLEAVELVRAA